MSCADILAVIGGITVAFYLLKLTWRCWCGFREFVLSTKWQVDLRAYGQWAATQISRLIWDKPAFCPQSKNINMEKQCSVFMLHVSGASSQRTAVVTGATSGIGKAYAIELARRGLDIVLISRCDNKLQIVAREIEDGYGRRAQIIPVDFTHGYSIYPAIAKKLQSLQIGILVNNVGMTSTNGFAYFLETPDAEQKITQVINCNILPVPQMTRLVLPDMVKRGKGLIINISSTAGVHPQPLLTLYSATKTFVTDFSQCLHAEYKSKGITIQCVTPLLVSTNMTKNVKVNSFMKNATAFAREALNTVGHSSCTTGCLSHALQNAVLTTLLPDRLRMSTFLIRKLRRSCKKKERTSEKEE